MSYTIYNNELKYIKDLNVRCEAIKFVGEIIEGKLLNNEFENVYLDTTQKAQATRAPRPPQKKSKTKSKWDYIKLKNLLHSKGNNQQNKETTYGMGENVCQP